MCNAAEAVLHDVGQGETVRFTTSVSVCRMPRMSALKLVLWGFLVLHASVVLAFVTGLPDHTKK